MNPPLEKRFDTPLLFIVFNRLETTRIVFEEIRKIKPSRLYIAGDGPRENIDDDKLKVSAVRDYISGAIDWDCNVETLFRDINLGCKDAVSSAISWFFENEPWGIILEDDCVPDQSFFRFCEELLQKYRDDTRIMMISGTNSAGEWKSTQYNYFYSVIGGIWGWASWRRAWKYYDLEMKLFAHPEAKRSIKHSLCSHAQYRDRIRKCTIAHSGHIDTWDFQWTFARLIQSGLSIVPSVNLIQNIGFGPDAVHSKDARDIRKNNQRRCMSFPLLHNPFIVPDREYDKFLFSQSRRIRFFGLFVSLLKKIHLF